MAVLTLSGVHIARVADLSTVVRLNAGVELEQSGGRMVRRVSGANGRQRSIRRPGRAISLSVTAPRIDRTTRETLEAWEGDTCLLRDGRGRVVFGFYAEPDFEELPGPPLCDVQLLFQSLTVDLFA